MTNQIGQIIKEKWSFGSTSESILPVYTPTIYYVNIPIIKKDREKGDWTTGLGFNCETDAEIFSKFLTNHLKRYIKGIKKEWKER